jgi:hypothetical protein
MDLKAKLDKKSIIQIAILVVLVAAGAGAYLTTQEGGLDFITGMLGGEERPQPAAAPAPKPSAAAKPEAPAIPAQPAKGQIAGAAFAPEAVMFEGGVLAFVQSKDPQSAVLIRVVAPKWETPSGKKFKYAPAGANSPLVTVNRLEQGELKPLTYSDKYTLVLEFGQEKDRKLPGKILLEVPGQAKTSVAGTFDAEIKGFRFVDGKPDLSADSTDTLQYLALHELLKDDPDKPIDIVAFRDGRYSAEAGEKTHSGYIEVEYRVGDKAPEIKRYQFVKDSDWKVRGTLALDQIDEAHPISAPGPKDRPEQLLSYLAAKRLEADVKKKSPKKGIYGVTFVTRHSVKSKTGVAETSYRTDPAGQPLKTAYLFKLKPAGWALERELTAKESVNVDTGKIANR